MYVFSLPFYSFLKNLICFSQNKFNIFSVCIFSYFFLYMGLLILFLYEILKNLYFYGIIIAYSTNRLSTPLYFS